MNIVRIGDKVVDISRAQEMIKSILLERSGGRTQQEVADRLRVERSFVSHLEGLAEVRRGNRIAIIGFPIGNKREVREVADRYGIDYLYLLSEKERISYVKHNKGAELFNETLRVIGHLKDYDLVIFLGSDVRISSIEKIIDRDIVGIPIGKSPIKKDCQVDIALLDSIVSKLVRSSRGGPQTEMKVVNCEEEEVEAGRQR